MTIEKFPVEAGHIQLFARALADDNPIYRDEDYAKVTECGSIIAPPTFTWAGEQFDPTSGLRPQPGQPWIGSSKEPTGVPPDPDSESGGGMHAEQHYEYHRPVRPGEVLTVEHKPGKIWTKEGRRAGKLTFQETISEYRNQDGELMVTATAIGVTTERVPATT